MGNNSVKKHGNGRQSTSASRPVPDYIYKIVLVGDYKSGKSSVCRRFAGKTDIATVMKTIGFEFESRSVSLDDTAIKLQMWDTSSQVSFREIIRHYYRGAHGFVVLYNVITQYTFDSVASCIEEIRKYGPPDAPVMVLGNMCDLFARRVVSYEDGRSLADGNDFLFFEVSAKDGTNIELALVTFAAKLREKHNDPKNCSKSSE